MQVPILFDVAVALNPELREWADEYDGAGTKMVRAASLGPGFIGTQIFVSGAKKVGSELGKVGDALAEGDNAAVISHLMQGYIKSQVFRSRVLGSRPAQKASEWLMDWWEGEAEDNIFNRISGIGDQE
jgi:hypothetical protein